MQQLMYQFMNVIKEEPQIVSLCEPVKMIGVGLRTTVKTIYRDAQTLGQRYQAIKTARLIQNQKEPWGFVAISRDFHEDGSWEYLMGDVVTDFDRAPDGLTCFEIPQGMYAKFTLQPRAVIFWGIATGLMTRYIYTEWLPNAPYVTNASVIGDFEYHDARSLSKKPEIDLYISIKKKISDDHF